MGYWLFAQPSSGCGRKTQRKRERELAVSLPHLASGGKLRNLVNHYNASKWPDVGL